MLDTSKIRLKRAIKWPTNRQLDNVLEDLELVFIHIPKTGGTSIRNVLQAFGPSKNRYPALGKHAQAKYVRAGIGARRWRQFRSFAVVRNPWDWTVSSYHWWTQIASRHVELTDSAEAIKNLGSFRSFVRSDYYKKQINEFKGKDYIEWITDGTELLVSDVLKLESLNEDWKRFASKYSLSLQSLPHLNQSKHDEYRSYYDDETIKLVADKFSATIDAFGYTFE